jgi:hypothetical protein
MARAIDLGKKYKLWEGWEVNRNGLISPEGDAYTPTDLYTQHFERQLLHELKARLRRPEQFDLFEENLI